MKTALAILCLFVLLAGCGPGSFVASPGPFTGTMTAAGEPIGQFSLTLTERQFGGTGVLTIAGNLVSVSISGLHSGKSIDGQMRNVNLGGGSFTGQFLSSRHASGSFTYVDTAETVDITGSWAATASAD